MKLMARSGLLLGWVVAASLFGASAVPAATTTTTVAGSMGPTQATCLQGLTNAVGDGEDCKYLPGAPSAYPALDPTAITGPYTHIAYYDSVAIPAAFGSTIVDSARVLYAPVNADGKMSQRVNGTVSVDDGGNGFGAGDMISFTLTLTSSGAGDIVRHYGSSIVEKYSSMTQVLASTVASSATANGSGGFDYVIASAGFPSLETFTGAGACLGQAFGSLDFGLAPCAATFTAGTPGYLGDPDSWTHTTTAGLGSLESNTGAKTTGSVTGLACIDSRSSTGVESGDCRDSQVGYSPYLGVGGQAPGAMPTAFDFTCLTAGGCVVSGVRGASEDVGWDQMLLKVSTDAAGKVIAVEGFNVDDYRVFGSTRCGDADSAGAGTGTYAATCNSWTSSYFTAGPLAANDDTASTHLNTAVTIDVLANDTGFVDPVTVTITVGGSNGGTAVVNGSPGSQAAVDITFTPSQLPGTATYTETFTYQVDDGNTIDSAVVTVTVNNALPTANAGAITVPVTGAAQNLDVSTIAGYAAGDAPSVVTATDPARGTTSVAGTTVTYTPDAGTFSGSDTFDYTVTDADGEAATATVTVTLLNVTVTANDAGPVSISTAGAAPASVSGSVNVSTIAGNSLGDGGATITKTDGANGTVAVAGNTVTYTPNAGFFTGADSFTYTITDSDNETDTGTVTVNIPDVSPGLAGSAVETPQDNPVDVSLAVTAGNGSLAQQTIAVQADAANGACTLAGATLTYTPDAGFTGDDSCTVRVTDGDGDFIDAVIAVLVKAPGGLREDDGGSSLDLLILALLGGTALARRRR